jgi:hypothetical protein
MKITDPQPLANTRHNTGQKRLMSDDSTQSEPDADFGKSELPDRNPAGSGGAGGLEGLSQEGRAGTFNHPAS